MNRSLLTIFVAAFAFSGLTTLTAMQSRTYPPTTAPSTQPLTTLLAGTYRGTVVDDDEVVACITRFAQYRGKISGRYTVRHGKGAYEGTLTDFMLVDSERLLCRFKWHDKHGDGLLTLRVAADGSSFTGSWGKEIIEKELIWTGAREKEP